jgi:hypothetical protein
MCLRGVWEGVTREQADKLIAGGQATADPSADHAKAVGPGKVSVLFQPPHPATRFRSYPDLPTAMVSHLAFLAKRFASAWPAVLAGDVDKFAAALHARGYFTASPLAYAGNMRRPYLEAMVSSAWNDAIDALRQEAISTVPEVDNPASEPTIHVDPSAYLRPDEWLKKDPDDVA